PLRLPAHLDRQARSPPARARSVHLALVAALAGARQAALAQSVVQARVQPAVLAQVGSPVLALRAARAESAAPAGFPRVVRDREDFRARSSQAALALQQ